jgi:hypothetical protein
MSIHLMFVVSVTFAGPPTATLQQKLAKPKPGIDQHRDALVGKKSDIARSAG